MADDNQADLIKYILACKLEAEDAKHDRMLLNKDNYAMFQLKHDFAHKEPGQSMEVLPKQRMAIEQTKSFFQQAIADLGEWFDIKLKDYSIPEEALPIKPYEAKCLLTYMQKQASYFSHVGNSLQSGLLGSLIITKTTGKMTPKPKFVVRNEGKGKSHKKNVEKVEDKSWQLKPYVVRQEDYYPDPTGKCLYEIEEMWCDLHEVIALSKGDDAIYDSELVSQLSTGMQEDGLHQSEKALETGQNTTNSTPRPKVKLLEFWGDVVSHEGELLHENVVMTLANDKWLIRGATPNPLWHQASPFTAAPILEVVNSVWGIALADAGTKLNRVIIELNNLILDAAFKKVHAISQIRVNDLVDVSQVSNGIKSGTKLLVKSTLPHGGKVMEAVEEADVPADAINVLNIYQQEFNAAMLTNDLRQGVMPFRAVKATEVVEASQTITSVFQGIAKNIEAKFIEPEIELQWMTIAQNWDLISKDIFVSLFGIQRGTELSQMDPQDVFVATVNGYKFQVYGISQTLSKQQDFRKLTTLLQTIGASDVLIEEFIKKFDFGKLLGEIMTALNIDKNKIAIPQQDGYSQGGQPAQAGGPRMGLNQDMSQVPAPANSPMADIFGSQGIPSTQFPRNVQGAQQ